MPETAELFQNPNAVPKHTLGIIVGRYNEYRVIVDIWTRVQTVYWLARLDRNTLQIQEATRYNDFRSAIEAATDEAHREWKTLMEEFD